MAVRRREGGRRAAQTVGTRIQNIEGRVAVHRMPLRLRSARQTPRAARDTAAGALPKTPCGSEHDCYNPCAAGDETVPLLRVERERVVPSPPASHDPHRGEQDHPPKDQRGGIRSDAGSVELGKHGCEALWVPRGGKTGKTSQSDTGDEVQPSVGDGEVPTVGMGCRHDLVDVSRIRGTGYGWSRRHRSEFVGGIFAIMERTPKWPLIGLGVTIPPRGRR
jgi:hypothetical protein